MPSTPHIQENTRLRLSRAGLWLLYAFIGFTLVGYATFGVHPELLARFPQVAGFYGVAFRFFALGQVWLAWVVLALFLVLYAGWRWLPAFVLLYVISLSSELLGTTYGIPFGEYRYSALLAPMWLDRVPIVIPLSWFFMAVPAYAIARWALGGRHSAVALVLLGSFILLAWDLSLDPAMSYATPYWIWGEEGPYYGMPWMNLFGWYVTGLVLLGTMALLRSDEWIQKLPIAWLGGFYLANLLLPVGMSAAAGLWGAVVVTLAALGGTLLLVRLLVWRDDRTPAALPAEAT